MFRDDRFKSLAHRKEVKEAIVFQLLLVINSSYYLRNMNWATYSIAFASVVQIPTWFAVLKFSFGLPTGAALV